MTCGRTVHAGSLVLAGGGLAGLTTKPPAHFVTFAIGAVGSGDLAVSRRLSIDATVRAQLYAHPEDEPEFGSWGGLFDVSAGIRIDAFRASELRSVCPFVTLRAGPGFAYRVPYCDCRTEQLAGLVFGGTLGVDLESRATPLRLQLSYDRPTFTTHDDSEAPVGEVSVTATGEGSGCQPKPSGSARPAVCTAATSPGAMRCQTCRLPRCSTAGPRSSSRPSDSMRSTRRPRASAT